MQRTHRCKTNNAGIAMASVLIIVTLIGLLASTILHLSYMAYTRKLVEKRNNENFYCAEAVLDTVKSVIQNSVADAIPQAELSEADFAKAAFAAITGNNLDDVKIGDEFTNIQNIQDYLFEKVTRDSTGAQKYDTNYYNASESTSLLSALTPVSDGGNGGSFSIGKIVVEEEGVRICDVSIVYVNDEGYTASITTDLVIRAPKYITVSDSPLGSYSMFAGCGAVVYSVGGSEARALNNMLYLHQEGNGYFGSMQGSDSKTALKVGWNNSNAGGMGLSVLSFEGTNVIFNGDIALQNGATLIFTGGPGTETARIRVNGYIILREGSNLFLAPNCIITCKGIVTDIEYNADGTVKSVTPYTGTGAKATVSQFYPVTNDYMASVAGKSSENALKLQEYYNGDIDVEELFYRTSAISTSVQNSDLDSKYADLYDNSKTKYAGVYVLNETADKNGWKNRTGCFYQLMQCSEVGNEWTWTLDGATSSMIYCNMDDENLNQEEKVFYQGKYYDAEFFKLVNVPILTKALTQQQAISQVVAGYSIEDDTTYDKHDWNYAKDNYSIIYNWSDLLDWDALNTLGYMTREFYVPKTINLVNVDYSSIAIPTTVGTFGISNKDNVSFGPADNFSVSSNSIQFFATAMKPITVRVTGGYSSGILLTYDKVTYGESTGTMRVISLIELGNKVTGDGVIKGLENDGNPVHELLEYIGSAYVYDPNQPLKDAKELALADNMFNGGMAAFWKMSTVSGGNSTADNSNNDLVDEENWNKD